MALIGWENAVEAATTALVSGSEAAGYPVQMLRVPIGAPSVAWQTMASVTASHVLITPAAAVTWHMVALSRTNLTSAATIRVRLGTVANITSAPSYDSGVVSAGVGGGVGQALHVLPNAVTADACRIDIADAGNPDGCLNIPLAYAGPARIAPISPNAMREAQGRSSDTETRGGQIIDQFLSRARMWRFQLVNLADADAGWIDDLEATAVGKRNVIFVPREDHARAARDAVFGLLTPEALGFQTATGRNRTWSATITERL